MTLRNSSSTQGNLVLDDLFLQLTRAPLLQSPSDLLTSGSRIHHYWRRKTSSRLTHYSYNSSPYSPENACCLFWYSPCLSLSDTYFFPLLLPAQMLISCMSCGCWGFLSMSLNSGLPEDTSSSLFYCKSCRVFLLCYLVCLFWCGDLLN